MSLSNSIYPFILACPIHGDIRIDSQQDFDPHQVCLLPSKEESDVRLAVELAHCLDRIVWAHDDDAANGVFAPSGLIDASRPVLERAKKRFPDGFDLLGVAYRQARERNRKGYP